MFEVSVDIDYHKVVTSYTKSGCMTSIGCNILSSYGYNSKHAFFSFFRVIYYLWFDRYKISFLNLFCQCQDCPDFNARVD